MTTRTAVEALRKLPGEHPLCCSNPNIEKITWDGEKWIFLTEWRIEFCPFCGSALLPYGTELIAYG